ncbi:hypothetical protein Sinac_4421 [Singulisphaera acidiphila DSM 18658]|uniref:Uncharacterized protein n=1 Tax=Singulisphaera acidiphila (strain ATCC BAA-1392 / DSM 18658 / VKM B-2454 / MOB10) TaxID=886293 RepID=L0DIX5_SINAD|nr:hypothetical protein Sinac_4421 [Singulisphaera acidiphila DSM 18658]
MPTMSTQPLHYKGNAIFGYDKVAGRMPETAGVKLPIELAS